MLSSIASQYFRFLVEDTTSSNVNDFLERIEDTLSDFFTEVEVGVIHTIGNTGDSHTSIGQGTGTETEIGCICSAGIVF